LLNKRAAVRRSWRQAQQSIEGGTSGGNGKPPTTQLNMALWGQGDPRWQVESRTDGTNVAGWHWAEINRIDWTKRRLAELLPGLVAKAEAEAIDDAPLSVRITSVKSVTGEVSGQRSFAGVDTHVCLSRAAA
jgi:hypothetical protein